MVKKSPKKSKSAKLSNSAEKVVRVNILPLLLIVFGLLAISFFIFWKINQYRLSFLSVPVASANQNVSSSSAKNLIIPSLNVNLGVSESVIKDGKWGVSDSGVSHLVGSANPGEQGTIIIYGHNKTEILGKINTLKRGDLINLEAVDGSIHGYKVLNTLTVLPKDTWILQDNGIEKLVIYTCTGFFDLQRFVVVAEPA